MARYIDADLLKEAFSTDTQHLSTFDPDLYNLIVLEIEEAPTADVREVRHGEWIFLKTYYEADECNCSLCGQLLTTAHNKRMNYCPNCGADMRGDDNEV